MSTVDVQVGRPTWLAARPGAWLGRRLPTIAGTGLVAVDALLVFGAFLLAHWAHFIAPDLEAFALDREEYARMGAVVALVTVVLFALHGFYDLDHRRSWLGRLRMIVSTVSTALVLTVAASFFRGDQRFSRLWFAAGWAFSAIGLVGWRWLAVGAYASLRQAVVPARKVLIVGANPVGREIGRDLAGGSLVTGYVDNGSDLERDVGLIGPIAGLERLVQQYAVDEIVVALPPHRREQLGRIIARGFGRPVQGKCAAELGELLPERFELHRHGGRSYIGFAPVAPVSWVKGAFDLAFGGLALLGQMSLVGPRPPVPSEVAQYEDWQHGRLRAIPGMTGLWQVSGRSGVPFHDMVRLDLHYIRNWSIWLDLEIILRTIPAVIGNRGAY